MEKSLYLTSHKPIQADMLIAIEGSDGSGKATQSAMLYEWMKENYEKALKIQDSHMPEYRVQQKVFNDVIMLDFPVYDTVTGGLVYRMLHGEYGPDASVLNPYFTASMYSLDRHANMRKLAIDRKTEKVVAAVSNRYTISNLIHQGAKLSDFDLAQFKYWLYELEYNKLQIPKPRVVIYLDVPFDVSYENVKKRAEETGATIDIQEKAEYLMIVEEHMKRLRNSEDWHFIDCYDKENKRMRSKAEIHQEIQQIVIDAAGKAVAVDGARVDLINIIPIPEKK